MLFPVWPGTPLISHPDKSWIVLAARISVCKSGVLR